NFDYPDFISYSDVEFPVTRGVDKYDRNFLVIKLQCTKSLFVDPNNEGNQPEIQHITIVLFQRYTDSNTWVAASCPSNHSFLLWSQEDYVRLELLLTGNCIKDIYVPYYRCYCTYKLG
ncbi:MAG TPA: hypothetical protein VKR58_10115, partial [Aquella sp.]|nr:hypothetical protein [Aquella sp.]